MKSRGRGNDAPLVELARCRVVLAGRPALDDVSFELRAGERWALLGPNGSGKSLFLKLLRGDVWPTPTGQESRIYCERGAESTQPPALGERWPFVGPERQDRYERYDWNFRVRAIVTTGLFDEDYPVTVPTRLERARVTRLLTRFGLRAIERRRFLTLSYGQRRLVMVARAFAQPGRPILLDEVFNGLDQRIRRRLLRALERPGLRATWVLSAHRAGDIPQSVTHLLHLDAGRINARGPLRRGELARLDEPASVVSPASSVAPHGRGRSEPGVVSFRISAADIYRDYRLVLRELDWAVHAGEHWAITGSNGSGKSTLLRLVYGDLHPALGGSIERRSHPAGTPIEEWKRRIGFVSPELQAEHAHAGTLEEVVVSGVRASVGLDAPPTTDERRRARRWLRCFGIGTLERRRTREVSYGQMRLALLARALINDPDLLLLDEPCTGLDPVMRARVLAMLEHVARGGVQVVMAVHHREDLIPSISHVLEIGEGGCARTIERDRVRERRRDRA